jgi:Zn finger protein HypA/HybF involved in hydrogenase expression
MEQSYCEIWDYCHQCNKFKIIHSDDKLCDKCRGENETKQIKQERDDALERLENAENEIGDLKTRIDELEGK